MRFLSVFATANLRALGALLLALLSIFVFCAPILLLWILEASCCPRDCALGSA